MTSDSEEKPKVIVVGSSGYVGKATLASLVARHGPRLHVTAGARNPDKFGSMDGVNVVAADMSDETALTDTLKGYDAVYLVVPGIDNRVKVGTKGLQAAKNAGVKFVLLLSVLTVEDSSTIFGKHFIPLENKVKQLGIDHAIVRLPLFIDNFYASAATIKADGAIYDPRDPDKLHTCATVADIGKASADILADPSKHNGKTYNIVSPPFCLNDVAAAFTNSLGKEVKIVTIPFDTSKGFFLQGGVPEWQVDGIMELFQLINAGSEATNTPQLDHVETITGEKPLTMEQWVEQNAAGFQ